MLQRIAWSGSLSLLMVGLIFILLPLKAAWFEPTLASTPQPISPATLALTVTTPLSFEMITPPGTVLTAPLYIDSTAGRLYAAGQVGDRHQILALATTNGRLLATYLLTGPLGLDPIHGRLYVDQDAAGLVVVDTRADTILERISLPGRRQDSWREQNPAPLSDITTGRVLAFRDNLVYVVDPVKREVVDILPFDVPSAKDCRLLTAPLPIDAAWYDPAGPILYLDFVTYVCTPWIGYTLLSYDLVTRTVISQTGRLPFMAVAAGGSLYGQDWHRFGIGSRWAWPGPGSTDWSGMPNGLAVDPGRARVYETQAGSMRVFDNRTMDLLMVVPLPTPGQLAGYDPQTDQLYFLADGQLQVWPAEAIRPPAPQPLMPAQPPAQAVSEVILSPDWPQDKTVAGLWHRHQPEGDCYVFDQFGSQFYLSVDGGATWGRPAAGLPAQCTDVAALAISPVYPADKTILAGIVGNGIFKSTDGGRLWRPISIGLPSMGIRQLLISPGFADDRTVFVSVRSGGLFRSNNGGETWQPLDVESGPIALSPEFDRDRTLMGLVTIYENQAEYQETRLSYDSGSSWQQVGQTPTGVTYTLLSLAPLFAKWQVAFGYGTNGVLYRSADGGVTWQAVLETTPSIFNPPQLVYAPGIEQNRPVFLLVPTFDPAGDTIGSTLYRSNNGGLSWQIVAPPTGVVPTALAISPHFTDDGLLFIGTADGQVVSLAAATLGD